MAFALMAVVALGVCVPASARGSRGDDDRGYRRDSSGFWGNGSSGMSRYPTTAEISQALYGTPPEPYDTSEDDEAPEVVQAG